VLIIVSGDDRQKAVQPHTPNRRHDTELRHVRPHGDPCRPFTSQLKLPKGRNYLAAGWLR
jgi:hypothetical protein